jgi:hypothetical protein
MLAPLHKRDVEGLHRNAVKLGAGRSSAQALLLCSKLLNMPLPEKLLAEVRADRVTRWLVSVALRAMTGAQPEKELEERPFGTVEIQLAHFFLGKGLSYKVTEAGQKLRYPAGRDLGPLSFMAPLLSLPRWIWRRRRTRIPPLR